MVSAGRKKTAYTTGAAWLVTLIILCNASIPDSQSGFILTILVLMLINLTSLLYSLTIQSNSESRIISPLIYILIFSTLFTAVTVFYTPALGYRLFFITSDSMSPSLLPGDIIWANTKTQNRSWEIDDIVVFNDELGYFYVKRIAPTPTNIRRHQKNKHYLLGDNLPRSSDSRIYGLVDERNFKAEVNFILYNFRLKGRFMKSTSK